MRPSKQKPGVLTIGSLLQVIKQGHGFVFLLILSEEGRESKKKEFTILFVPRKTMLCERKLTVSLCYVVHDISKCIIY